MRSRSAEQRHELREWQRVPSNPDGLDPRVVEAIIRRRRQILVHSYLYYYLDDPIVSDHTWTHWAQQLLKLQQRYGSRVGFYDEAFSDWNGSTGHHLPVDVDVVNSARRLRAYHDSVERLLGAKWSP